MTKLKTSHKICALVVIVLIVALCYFSVNNLIPDSLPNSHSESSLNVIDHQSSEQQQQSEDPTTTITTSSPESTSAANTDHQKQPSETTVSLNSNQHQVVETIKPLQESSFFNFNDFNRQTNDTTETSNSGKSQTDQPKAPQQTATTSTSTVTTLATSKAVTSVVVERSLVELEAWKKFKATYGKKYKSEQDERLRLGVFLDNSRFINTFNERTDVKFKLAMNQFGDYKREEINNQFIGPSRSWAQSKMPVPIPMTIVSSANNNKGKPQTVDWRNLTEEPTNQGMCGVGAVYAAIANLESVYNKEYISAHPSFMPVKLSEEQVLDCMRKQNKPPCLGHATMVEVYDILQGQQTGWTLKESYAQLKLHGDSKEPLCELPLGTELAQVKLNSFSLVHEDNFEDAILNSGPLTVALDASQSTFHFYSSGLYHDEECSAEIFNHHALVVGISTSVDNEQPGYLLVRNSFGKLWGESGHMRILRHHINPTKGNRCLPQQMAIQPTIMDQIKVSETDTS